MDITEFAPSQSISPNQAGAKAEDDSAEGALTKLTTDFETFLKMLTTQLENQDPLNPMKSDEFASQLATFSGVEQQVRTNDLLEQLVGGVGGLSEAAQLVGMELRTEGPAAFKGEPVTLYPNLPDGTEQAILVVRDALGAEVSRFSVPVDNAPISWGGTDQGGASVEPGTYSFTIETAAGGTPTGRTIPEVYSPVVEARMENGAPLVVLASGASLDPDTATAVRAPVNAETALKF
ncbi:MAG: flagellar hook capping FlgD N-terminal domain-containing protein [Pseudomonadota bacterium]